jgi:hypothetical protein
MLLNVCLPKEAAKEGALIGFPPVVPIKGAEVLKERCESYPEVLKERCKRYADRS